MSLPSTIFSMTSARGFAPARCQKYEASSIIPGTVSDLIQFLISVLSPIQALALAIRYVLVVVQSRPAACSAQDATGPHGVSGRYSAVGPTRDQLHRRKT